MQNRTPSSIQFCRPLKLEYAGRIGRWQAEDSVRRRPHQNHSQGTTPAQPRRRRINQISGHLILRKRHQEGYGRQDRGTAHRTQKGPSQASPKDGHTQGSRPPWRPAHPGAGGHEMSHTETSGPGDKSGGPRVPPSAQRHSIVIHPRPSFVVRETKEINVSEDANWNDQISKLQPHTVRLEKEPMRTARQAAKLTI